MSVEQPWLADGQFNSLTQSRLLLFDDPETRILGHAVYRCITPYSISAETY